MATRNVPVGQVTSPSKRVFVLRANATNPNQLDSPKNENSALIPKND